MLLCVNSTLIAETIFRYKKIEKDLKYLNNRLKPILMTLIIIDHYYLLKIN